MLLLSKVALPAGRSCESGNGIWRESLVSVYVAYSDESGTPDKDGIFLVGGYVADQQDWPAFAEAWQKKVLQSPPIIPYLHIAELRGKEFQQKHGLTEADALHKVRRAVNVIRESNFITGYFGEIERKDFSFLRQYCADREVVWPDNLNDPDYLPFIAYAELTMRRVVSQHTGVRKIDFVVSRKRRVSHHCVRFTDEIRATLNPALPGIVGDLLPASMEEHEALQAADLLCWHIQRVSAKSATEVDLANLESLCESGLERAGFSSAMMQQLREGLVRSAKVSGS